MTTFKVHAISQTITLTFPPRQPELHPPDAIDILRLERTLVADLRASVIPWKSGARASAAAF